MTLRRIYALAGLTGLITVAGCVGRTGPWLPDARPGTDPRSPLDSGASSDSGSDSGTGSDVGADSGSVLPTAASLTFSREPWNPSAAGREIPVVVTIRDVGGQTVTTGPDATAVVTLSLTAGTDPLNGNLSRAAAAGVADFTGAGISVASLGVGKVLTATKADTTGAGGSGVLTTTSDPFDVVGDVAWTGSVATAVWLTTGQTPAAATGDGMFYAPAGAFLDGTTLYVADSENHRLVKLDTTTGAFVGWVGAVAMSPTGGAPGCNGRAIGTLTPGWCTGGSALVSADPGGFWNPGAVYVDGNYVYGTSKGSHAVNRFDKTTGAFAGWLGGTREVPSGAATGGPAACTTTPSGASLPGWCLGGFANVPRSGDGMLYGPTGIVSDGSYLYVAETGNNRVSRFDLGTGAFAGWIGRVLTTPTGGAGCTALAPGAATPGWCIGGSTQAGDAGDGSLFLTYFDPGITVDGTYIYVSDSGNDRVNRYDAATGAFAGWTGKVATTPTGGAGCTALAPGSITPGWCSGGTSASGTEPGASGYTGGITHDGSHLYVTTENRVHRYLSGTGAFDGWLGRIGESACTGTTIGAYSGKWCMNGTAEHGHGDGMLDYATGIATDGAALWVVDGGSHRLNEYDATTAAFLGWSGAKATPTGGWVTTGLAAGARDDASFMSPAGLTTDGARLFVLDALRVKQVELSTAAPQGWVGSVGYVSPTGGAPGCASAPFAADTPGWCLGGEAGAGGYVVSGGLSSAGRCGLARDASAIYAVDYGLRIVRYAATTGAYLGWTGRVGAEIPTSGDPGCATVASGDATPGWCFGGSNDHGDGDGQFYGAYGLAHRNGYLYVADSGNSRVQRIDTTTGRAAGWVGRVATTPTGGAAGCTTTAVGDVTPGWCLGGTAQPSPSSEGDGGLYGPWGVSVDDDYVYVGDFEQQQVVRYEASSGAFAGWIGHVDGIPTGPAFGGPAACASAVRWELTPGWCVGGTSTAGDNLEFPSAVYADGTSVYIGFYSRARLTRVDAATGALTGWRGEVETTPTGGDPGCTTALPGSLTPGWCTGGESADLGGQMTGVMSYVNGLTGFGHFLYVADTTRNRLLRLTK